MCYSFAEALYYFTNQILLFAVANKSSKFLPIFKEAAKSFKGKVILSVDPSNFV